MIPLIDNYEYNTKSALALIEETKDLIIPQNAILASFDVKSMYPNVPTDRALDLIMRQADKFPDIKPHKKFIAKSLKIIFSANYFIFNGIIYLQLTGCPMGSPLSLTLSNIIMQEVEKQTLKHNPYQPFFFRRYIDDYFIIWEHDRKDLDIFLENMNKVYPTIKLTSEIEKNKSIAFLDLKITRGYNDHLYFNIYRKPSYVPIPFNAISDHPFSSKKAYFRSHILRAKSHTTFDFQEKSELNYIRKLAIEAGFTKKWINDLILNTLSPPHKFSSQLISTVNNNDPKTQRYTTPIPYSQHFCNIQKYARRKFNIKIPFARPRDTSSLIVNNKDFGLISGGVYRIEFLNKEDNEYKIYIGQTCRKLSARINEHKKGKDNKYCGTAVKQFLNNNPEYTPKWDDVKILAAPRDHQSLLIREAIEIFQNSDKCINAKDGSKLPEIWQSYLTKFT